MTAFEKLISTAKAELGYQGRAVMTPETIYKPVAGKVGKFNKYAYDLDKIPGFYNGKKNGFDWCDVFVDWCFVKTFGVEIAKKMLYQPDNSLGAGTKYSMQYYQRNDAFTPNPVLGSQIFFGNSESVWHTGIVVDFPAPYTYVYTIEGNSGNPGAVRSCKYPVGYSTILGYGKPNYSLVFKEEETTMPNEPHEWAKEAWDKFTDLKITDGSRPLDNCTREEVVVMLYRLARLLEK